MPGLSKRAKVMSVAITLFLLLVLLAAFGLHVMLGMPATSFEGALPALNEWLGL